MVPRHTKILPFVRATLAALSLHTIALPAAASAVKGEHRVFLLGYSSKTFVNIPREDVRVATQILTQKVARRTIGPSATKIYDTQGELEKDLKAGQLDAVALTMEEYIRFKDSRLLEPVLTIASGNTPEFRLLLLTRKDRNIKTVAGMKNLQISFPSTTTQFGSTYQTWAGILAMREGASTPQDFFSSIRETRNASQALMAVFFRKSDACIVTDYSYAITSELNPQISKELSILASSDRLVGGIVAFRRDLPGESKQKIYQALTSLHNDQEGRQLFVLFQMSKIVPFHSEHLKGMEAMLSEHNRLKTRIVKR